MDQKSPEAFRTISEVADWLGVPTHVLRFWESRFSQVKPIKRAGGRRYYRPSDMELLGGIRQLLHEDGMTIRGVQKLLREKGVKHVAEMSPPLDLAADTKDATPDNVVELAERRDGSSAAEQAAQQTSDSSEDGDKPWYESGVFAQGSREAGTESAEVPDAEELSEAEAAAPEFATPEVGEAETVETAAPAEATGPELEEAPEATEIPEPITADPMPEPEAMEFLAHDAAPETHEEETAGETEAPVAAEPVETDPLDPMSSPEALEFAAHEAEPVTVEEAPAPPPALIMPEIGPDPSDEDVTLETLPLVTELRAARKARMALNTATLQALADRLDEIAGRMDGTTGRHGGN